MGGGGLKVTSTNPRPFKKSPGLNLNKLPKFVGRKNT